MWMLLIICVLINMHDETLIPYLVIVYAILLIVNISISVKRKLQGDKSWRIYALYIFVFVPMLAKDIFQYQMSVSYGMIDNPWFGLY